MKRLAPLALALIVGPALLGGCASVSGTSAASLDGAKTFVAAEAAYDAAVQTADTAIDTGQLASATVTKLKSLADSGHVYVVAGRVAVSTANATDLATETAALAALVAQIAALTKG